MKGRAGPIVIARIITECLCSIGLEIPEAAAAMDEKNQDMPTEYTGRLCQCVCLPERLALRFKPSRSISNLLKKLFLMCKGKEKRREMQREMEQKQGQSSSLMYELRESTLHA